MKNYGLMRLSSDGRTWLIEDVEPHVSIRLKQLFRAIPKSNTPPYKLTKNPTTDADLEWFLHRYPLMMTDADRRSLTQGRQTFLDKQAELESILIPSYQPNSSAGLKEGQEIRPYQWQAIEVLRKRKSLLLGDEGGLGKTYVAAGFLASEPQALPAAVVCDAHMQRQWKEKIEAFTNLRVHMITKGNPYDLPKADAYIFKVTSVLGWTEIFRTRFFKAAIYDEPQSLRAGTATAKGSACAVLSKYTDFHLGLTATPIYNYGDEMWRIMQFIDADVLGEWGDFAREWCSPFYGKYRVEDPKALGTYMREQYAMLRRLKSDVGQQLPKVSRIVEHIDYDQKAVDNVEELARTLALRATTATFVERGMAARELDIMVRHATGVSKAKAVATFAKMMVESGESVVIWGWHRDVYDIWLEELKDLKPAMFTGSESASQKEKAKNSFLNGETDVLIMSLRSGAGLDGLQARCSVGIFGELDWSPGIHRQCIWRLDREGQTSPVTIFYLVVDDGSDPPMMDVLGIKASQAQAIVDPGVGPEVSEDDTSRLTKLVERYLDKRKAKGQAELPLADKAAS